MSKTTFVRASLVVLAGKVAAVSAKRRLLASLGPAYRDQCIDCVIREAELMLRVQAHEVDHFMDLFQAMVSED